MTATAFIDIEPTTEHEYVPAGNLAYDYELLAAIDPMSLRPQLTVLDGGRSTNERLENEGDHRVYGDRGGAPARAVASGTFRRESEMVEIYRRRRFLAALVVTAVVVALALASGLSLTSFGATPASSEPMPHVHVVSVGDTYPSIATELGADDPNAFAETLRSANGDAQLLPGQRLVINLATLG